MSSLSSWYNPPKQSLSVEDLIGLAFQNLAY